MRVEIEFEFWNRLKKCYADNSVTVEIKEITECEFPVAFIVRSYGFSYENEEKPEWKILSDEIRVHNEKLWKAVGYADGADHIRKTVARADGSDYIECYIRSRLGGIFKSSAKKCREDIARMAENYIIFAGEIWKPCEEPMYKISTFGSGNNDIGTQFQVAYGYRKDYFNALEREEAIAYGKMTALNRGDTESVEKIGDNVIEVLMPGIVKKNQKKEYGY